MVSSNVAVALGIICILLIAFIAYFSVTGISAQNSYNNLKNQKNQLQSWLDGNKTLLNQTQTWLEDNITDLQNEIASLNSTYNNYVSDHNYTNEQVQNLQNQLMNLTAPTLFYDFSSTINYNPATGQYYGGSLLGWNASGQVSVNETDAVAIHPFSSISRQFQALNSNVGVSFNWTSASGLTRTETMTVVVHRQLNGVFSDLTYNSNAEGPDAYTYNAAFGVDNGTMFTVELTMNNYALGFLYQVELWNSAQVL